MTPQLLLLFWREITLLGFLQVLECEKGRSIILTLRLGLDLVDDGTAIDYLGGTLLAFKPRPVTLAPLPSYHTMGYGAEFKSSKESRKCMKWTHHKTLQSQVHCSCNKNNQTKICNFSFKLGYTCKILFISHIPTLMILKAGSFLKQANEPTDTLSFFLWLNVHICPPSHFFHPLSHATP